MRNQDANDEMDELIRRSTQVEIPDRSGRSPAAQAGGVPDRRWNSGRRAAGASGVFPDFAAVRVMAMAQPPGQ